MNISDLSPDQLAAVLAARAAYHRLSVPQYLKYLRFLKALKHVHGEVDAAARWNCWQRAKFGSPDQAGRAAHEQRTRAAVEHGQQARGRVILAALNQSERPEPGPR